MPGDPHYNLEHHPEFPTAYGSGLSPPLAKGSIFQHPLLGSR